MAVKFQGGRAVPVKDSRADVESLKTDLRESSRLLDQVYTRMRNAYVEANSAGINSMALNNLKGIGADIRAITAKIDATFKALM